MAVRPFPVHGLCAWMFLALAATCQGQTVSAAPAREWRTPAAGDAARGQVLYQTHCTACHAVDTNKTGPAHRGVMGRRIGSLAGYAYSAELARSRLRWTPQTLNAWLEDPEELVAGQRMGFQVESAADRADLIAYLATLR
jgi:cytochrome c